MNREIRDKVYIVFEAGPTHSGYESALKLIDVAAESGADAIKFQVMDVDRLMGEDVEFSYKILADKKKEIYKEVKESLKSILKRRELSFDEWKKLKEYADSRNLDFICTAMFPEEIDFLVDIGVKSIKIASSDINNYPLMRHCAKKGVNIQIDTGSAEIWEIEKAVREIEKAGNDNIIIHHCPSGYPSPLEGIHLNMIPTLRRLFPKYAIGFSDHSPGWEMDIAAVSLGALVLEKTITLDRATPSIEHCFSLEPEDAKRFVDVIRKLEIALGEQRRVMPPDDRARKKARRSIFAVRDIKQGDEITADKIDLKRPGYGIGPEFYDMVIGAKARRDIPAGKMISFEDIELHG